MIGNSKKHFTGHTVHPVLISLFIYVHDGFSVRLKPRNLVFMDLDNFDSALSIRIVSRFMLPAQP